MFSVIFDMDGTLLDTQKIYLDGWEYAGLEQGIKGLGEHIKYVCGMNCAGWSKYLTDRYAEIDIDKFNADVVRYVVKNLKVAYKTGAVELLSFLKESGVKVALASGSSLDTIAHHLKEVGGEGIFDVVVSGDEVAHGKPAPDIFLLTAERMGVSPEECIVFEDSENGIRAAHNAGMRAIGVPDIAEFSPDIDGLLFAKLETLDQAIEIFEKKM